MATTPPPRTSVCTPSAPRFGARFDPSPTRNSTQTRYDLRAHQTPPLPSSPSSANSTLELSLRKRSKSCKTNFTRASALTFSPPPSAHSSPKKRLTKITRTGSPEFESEVRDIHSNFVNPPSFSMSSDDSDFNSGPDSTMAKKAVLPTPAKTPKSKRYVPSGGLGATSRVLFSSHLDSVDELMPAPKKAKRSKKYAIYSMIGEDEEEDEDIEIFTDSKDRVPELDTSEDNPFYVAPDRKERQAKEAIEAVNKTKNKTYESARINYAVEKDIGMFYTFRGNKVFRRFNDEGSESDGNGSMDELNILNDGDIRRGVPREISRKSVQPRLLFPNEAQRRERAQADSSMANGDEMDEFAATPRQTRKHISDPSKDIHDDRHPSHDSADEFYTPASLPHVQTHEERIRHEEASSIARVHSPFDEFKRTKSAASSSSQNSSPEKTKGSRGSFVKGKKRAGSMSGVGGAAKKARKTGL
ncbi:MAG: hypothetical protein M1819_003916 [Sarea resinae]|nr:MAG: hypothetical protein M1819_003916 [Sarea resinae]